jgi:lipoate-protein ligase A
LLSRLIRVGRERLSERGVRSADKVVSPLSEFTPMDCAEVAHHMERSFGAGFHTHDSAVSREELEAAQELADMKYATAGWINRLP